MGDVRVGDNQVTKPTPLDYLKFAMAVVGIWTACEHVVQQARRLGLLK